MAYLIGQYNHRASSSDSSSFMTELTSGRASRRNVLTDNEIISSGSSSDSLFQDECLRVTDGLFNSKNYYFHGKIKRMDSDQIFYVKIVNFNDNSNEQYIKTITVAAGDPDDWVDVEFMFTPFLNTFDTLLFELKRGIEDFTSPRYPKLIYIELSYINNAIDVIQSGKDFVKIGIQSRPGLMTCINGEEIRLPRTGIYELRNGLIIINFFSVVCGSVINNGVVEDTAERINIQWNNPSIAKKDILSVCLMNSSDYPRTKTIDSFTLDYLYQES